MSGRRWRVALLVPASNTVMEPDFVRELPPRSDRSAATTSNVAVLDAVRSALLAID
jgi:maleate cis-trans isomerase